MRASECVCVWWRSGKVREEKVRVTTGSLLQGMAGNSAWAECRAWRGRGARARINSPLASHRILLTVPVFLGQSPFLSSPPPWHPLALPPQMAGWSTVPSCVRAGTRAPLVAS